jgi:hypothetical protein
MKNLALLGVVAMLALSVADVTGQQQGGGRGGGGAAAAQGGGRGAAQSGGVDPILVGVIDTHFHSGPDSRGRSIDFLDGARYAKLKGMRGAVLKHHRTPTAGYAYLVRKEVPGFEAFGLIDLNTSVGGLNMAAVEEFMATTMPGLPPAGRVIMLASDDTPYQLQVSKATTPAVTVVRNGQLVPEAVAIIQYAVKNNLTVTTGHHNGEESVIIVREAIKLGMNPQRVGVTHANINPPGLTVQQMQEVAKMGAFVEMCTQSQRANTPEAEKALAARDDRIADLIKQVGANNVIIQTDLGQANNEYHPDGIVAFVRNMWARGISRADTDIMTKRNPARYLGIPEPPTTATN